MPEGRKRAKKYRRRGGLNTFFLKVWKAGLLPVWAVTGHLIEGRRMF